MKLRLSIVTLLIAVILGASCSRTPPASPAPETRPAPQGQPTAQPQPTAAPKPTTAPQPAPGATPTAPAPAKPTAPAAAAPKVKGTFIAGESGGDAETLNWILAADASSFSYVGLTIDSLATYDNSFNLKLLMLAREIEVSPDGLRYTITIRDDLRWTDGTKVTADDYVYTLKNLMFSDWLNYNYKDSWMEQVGEQQVFVDPAVVNETTFTITRKTVDPEFLDTTLISLSPYPRHIAQKYEGDAKAFTEAPEFNNLSYTGNLGPYKFDEWVRNDKFVVSRNPDYYLGKPVGAPYFEKYTIKLFGTPATRQAALEAKDITYTGIEPAQVGKFKGMNWINVYTIPSTGYTILSYNLRDNGWSGLKDPAMRQALSMSVSKELMISKVLEGFGEPAYSFIPKTSPWYSEEGLAKYGVGDLYNKNKARELLLQNGYGHRLADGSIRVSDKEGKPIRLSLLTTTGSTVSESIVLLIKQELADIGIQVDVKFVPWATLLSRNVRNKVPGSNQEPAFNNGPTAVSDDPWDMILMAFNTNPIAPSGQSVFFTKDGGLNFNGYFNDSVDSLFKRLHSAEAINKDNRKKLYAELGHILSTEQPVSFLDFGLGNYGFQKTVKGIEPGLNMGYNSYLWYFE